MADEDLPPVVEVSNNTPPPDFGPAPDEPQPFKIASVTLWQARTVLRAHNLFDAVDTYVEAHKVDIPQLYEVWNYGNAVSRTSPLIAAIGALPQFNLTDEQIDAMFMEAASLTA
jgi:hypothetical protein